MNEDNHDELDLRIKEALNKTDKVVVPTKISEGIDETLKNLDNKKNYTKKKIAMAISLIVLLSFMLLTPLGVDAIKAVQDAIYTYIPSLGVTIEVDELIYTLEEPISKVIDKKKITLTEVFYDTDNNLIRVDVEGNGKFPQNKSILKIKNKKIKSFESSISDMSNEDRNISWGGSYFFKYNKPYNNENIEFNLILENKEEIQITCNLKEAKNIKDIVELGPSDKNRGITITGVINEKDNILEVKDKLIEGSNIDVKIESIKREYDDCIITLKYGGDEKRYIQLVDCVIVPAGDSILENKEEWFEGGLSGSPGKEGSNKIKELTFKLPYVDADKLYIKVRGSEYKFIGPWEIRVD